MAGKYVICRNCAYKQQIAILERENAILRHKVEYLSKSKAKYQTLFNLCPAIIRGVASWRYSKKN